MKLILGCLKISGTETQQPHALSAPVGLLSLLQPLVCNGTLRNNEKVREYCMNTINANESPASVQQMLNFVNY